MGVGNAPKETLYPFLLLTAIVLGIVVLFLALITAAVARDYGQAFIVPPERIVKAPNPSGHVVIFIGYNDKVLCFVDNGGV